jgi:hypothetical protein
MPGASALPVGGRYGRERIERGLPYPIKAHTRYELRAEGVQSIVVRFMPVTGGGPTGMAEPAAASSLRSLMSDKEALTGISWP